MLANAERGCDLAIVNIRVRSGCKTCWRTGLPGYEGRWREPYPPCSNPDPNHAGKWEDGAPAGKVPSLPKNTAKGETLGDRFYKRLKQLGYKLNKQGDYSFSEVGNQNPATS